MRRLTCVTGAAFPVDGGMHSFFTVGFVSGTTSSLDMLPVIVKAVRIVGNNTGSVADLAQAARAIAANRIVPVIDQVFDIGSTAAAYAELGTGRHFGKIAIAH